VLQLHGAADEAEVRTTIKEIVANLLGSEEVGLFRGPVAGALSLVDGIGVDPARHPAIVAASPLVREALTLGRTCVATGGSVVACVPLVRDERVTGAIVLFGLLPQKAGLEPADHELFDLLSTHAALALHQAEVRAQGPAVGGTW
jgi:hypothetical protein